MFWRQLGIKASLLKLPNAAVPQNDANRILKVNFHKQHVKVDTISDQIYQNFYITPLSWSSRSLYDSTLQVQDPHLITKFCITPYDKLKPGYSRMVCPVTTVVDKG